MLELSGNLDRLHLGDLLEWLHLTRASGKLLLSAGAATRTFDIVNGRVAFASSSRASERLASWLLRKGLAPRGALLRALAISQTSGEPFTAVVEREAGVTHRSLMEAGRSLATALVSRVLREDSVSFKFDPSWPVGDRLIVDLQLECSSLMMNAAYAVDTRPPQDHSFALPAARLDREIVEGLFWRTAASLEDEVVDAAAFAAAHQTLLSVGEVLNRWVTQGPPLLPLGPDDCQRAWSRLRASESIRLEDSPTLAWNLLSLVNGLDAPSLERAASFPQAWDLAGDDAALLVRLLLGNSRWQRSGRGFSDQGLRRSCLVRISAARVLAPAGGLPEEVAATAAALPVVLLELVATALASSPIASPGLRRSALRNLLPVVGRAAGLAAGLPEILLAALSGSPADHPGAVFAGLVIVATDEDRSGVFPGAPLAPDVDPSLAATLGLARNAAQAADVTGEGS